VGVFDDGGGGEAFFGTGTTLEAQTTLKTTSSSGTLGDPYGRPLWVRPAVRLGAR
jgi:hypothetical protein